MAILIKNCTILSMSATASDPQKKFLGSIGVVGNRILFASDSPSDVERFTREHGKALQVIDGTDQVAMPGLINLHNHVSMTLMRGYADDMALMPWLEEKIWPFEAQLTGEDIYQGAQLGIAEMLLGGTTTFVDMYWHPDRVAQAAQEMGMRAFICPTFVGDGVTKAMAEADHILEHFVTPEGLIQVMLAPHAPYTCPPETLSSAIDYCKKRGLRMHIHVSETKDELRTIHERYGKTPVEHLRDLGLFDVPTLIAHGVHLCDSDIEILHRHNVSVAHNPQSNMKLASGIAPIAQLLSTGVNVGLGTDGPSSNNDLDLWEELRTATLLQKVASGNPEVLPAYQTLQMATVHGAKALGMEGELGVLKAGARADIILIDLNKPHLTPCHDLVANLVYAGKASDVHTVIVDGKVIISNRQFQSSPVAERL